MDRVATAFNHRDVEYSLMSIGESTSSAAPTSCIRWARELWPAMQPYSSSGVYVYYLGQEAGHGERLFDQ